ncbi:hypothetical protein HYH02_009365 [Chlamydomonas schloesseri]|uniref:Cytidyltransferase-like domain-containing protein n=1 Tax=Chlamydomonas schloesseri TaxID=2026947 RepID=A0A835TQ88_9CHLO|nr:hypothetical protein HYH02_009365 [Chlamydomonas schloesseri]|eukprot:KAG2443295.1 hypothetical protein HYH02_009365 [Chlamydomonas schloesseri]
MHSSSGSTQTRGVLVVLGDVNARSAAAAVQEALSAAKRVECSVIFAGVSSPAADTDLAASNAAAGAAAAGAESPVTMAVTAGEINAVACLLDAVALSRRPQLRCVPLLPAAGWSLERVVALPAVTLLLPASSQNSSQNSNSTGRQHQPEAAGEPGLGPGSVGGVRRDEGATASTSSGLGSSPASAAAAAVAERLSRQRPAQLPAWQVRTYTPPPEAPGDGPPASAPALASASPAAADPSSHHNHQLHHQPQQPQQPATNTNTAPATTTSYTTLVDGSPAPASAPLRFSRVAVGGTFDRLHAGHELLLAATALVAERFVFVGVTADALLANKSHRELLQTYDARAGAALSYLTSVRPGLQVEAGPLSDPKAPTLAELDPAMEALVVSVETLPGAIAINKGRAARGFAPLTVITVPVIGVRPSGGGSGGGAGAAGGGVGEKLSSSGLRAAEATLASASMDEGAVLV